jgi:hypothetical protein
VYAFGVCVLALQVIEGEVEAYVFGGEARAGVGGVYGEGEGAHACLQLLYHIFVICYLHAAAEIHAVLL